ncbi:MAG: Spy/CpxP family protein refolding chaperone [Vicinamibacterales bacterium]
MSVAWRPAALLAVLLALVPHAVTAQGFKWWQSGRFQRELQLTTDQISRIEDLFQAALPELRQHKKALDRLEDDLSRLIDTSAEEDVVMAQADQVEEVRSELSKARTRMLLRMRRVLTADQRVKLGALHDEWDRNRKRQDRRK